MTSPVTSPVTSPASAPATAPTSAPATASATTKADASADATMAEATQAAEAVPAVFKDGEKVMCSPVTHDNGLESSKQVTISGAPVWDEDLGGFCYNAS